MKSQKNYALSQTSFLVVFMHDGIFIFAEYVGGFFSSLFIKFHSQSMSLFPLILMLRKYFHTVMGNSGNLNPSARKNIFTFFKIFFEKKITSILYYKLTNFDVLTPARSKVTAKEPFEKNLLRSLPRFFWSKKFFMQYFIMKNSFSFHKVHFTKGVHIRMQHTLT